MSSDPVSSAFARCEVSSGDEDMNPAMDNFMLCLRRWGYRYLVTHRGGRFATPWSLPVPASTSFSRGLLMGLFDLVFRLRRDDDKGW